MATVESPRSKYDDAPRSRRKKKSHAFRNGSIAMLVLLAIAVYFAPTFIARTPLRNSLLASALKLDGTITLGATSLGWFSGVVVNDIEIRDANGDLAVQVAQLRTTKPLVGLLLDFGDVGLVEIDRPTVHAVCHEQDTNLERIFSKLLTSEEQSKVAAELKVSAGTIEIEDVTRDRTFRIEKLVVDCKLADDAQPIVMAASGDLPNGRQPGQFKLDLRTGRSADGKNPLASGQLNCDTTALPLELADPVLRRRVQGAELSGHLSTRLAGAWGKLAESGEASVQGEALVTDLVFAAKALGSDRIQLQRVEVPCHLVQTGDVLDVEQLSVTCELGKLALTGKLNMDDFASDDKLSALLDETYDVNGELDLVALARALPETLRIRQGTEITSGTVRLAVTSRQQNGESVWSGQIDTSHLGAQANGKSLVWENPLAINFAARQTAAGLRLDRAECTSSFLHANASGSLDDLSATASFDLSRLVTELEQFADLSQLKLAGEGEARLVLKRVANDRFDADGEFQVTGFQFVPVAGGEPWHEDKVVAKLDMEGQFEKEQLRRIERALLTVEVGRERLTAQLREPIIDPATSIWPVECTWNGDLAPWSRRLEACAGMTGWQLGGTGKLDATLSCTRKAIEIDHARADVAQLQAWGPQWFINEPSAVVTLAGRWNLDEAQGQLTEARLTAGTTSAVATGATFRSTADGLALNNGTAQLGAELATLYRWRHDPRVPAAWRVSGRLAAQAELKHDAKQTTARVDGTIDQLELVDLAAQKAGPATGTWQESRITLAGLAVYSHASEALQLDHLQVAATALRCDASGTVPCSTEGGNVDVKGTVQYDWQQLAPLWRPWLGDGVQVAGRQARTFAVHGQLSGSPGSPDSWRNVTGDMGLGWSGMNLYGLQVGQGEIVAHLAEGQLSTKPIDVQVSEGRLTLTPIARLTPAPAELYVSRGPLLSNVHLTPDMCRRGLKFVAPIVAETTVAEGRFSVSMDGGRIPLADPRAADLAGHMAIRAKSSRARWPRSLWPWSTS